MERKIKSYLNFLSKEKKLSNNTIQSYTRDIDQFKKYVNENNINYLEISEKELNKYFDYLKDNGKKSTTISRNIATIRAFYNYLLREDIIKKDPTRNIKSPKIDKKKSVALTSDEVTTLLNQPSTDDLKGLRDKAMLEFAYATGMKVSEIVALNIDDFDEENQSVTCKSGKRSRTIKLGALTVNALTEYIEVSRYNLLKSNSEKALFVNTNGSRLTRQGFWKIIKYYKDQANIDKEITPHVLRQSFATHLFQTGIDTKTVQTMLGLSDVYAAQSYKKIDFDGNIKTQL